MPTIKESLQAINKAKYDLKLNASLDTLKPEFNKLFADHPGLKGFAYLAYTPGFNDGDPCYRHENIFIGDGDDSRDYDEICEFLYDESIEDTDDVWINKDCKTVEQARKDVALFDYVFELLYDTNYIVKVSINNVGDVSIDYDDYDCGY